jgi:hypothetical protein
MAHHSASRARNGRVCVCAVDRIHPRAKPARVILRDYTGEDVLTTDSAGLAISRAAKPHDDEPEDSASSQLAYVLPVIVLPER